ncbi:sulfotransferase [Azospirillum sp. B506]|uniref:sulfotransferase n=1 Tax=Azospirillum sp. B506 TaxID=137721 RepID=UPI00131F0A75|nr:sulfotransferase [Azospirillum sp. B506]
MAVGAIGGSGTRVVASIVQSIGYFIGKELNQSYDNMLFSRIFKRTEILDLPEEKFSRLVEDFSRDMTHHMSVEKAIRWGWKEPNTHIVVDRLRKVLPTLKYIHVIRNGLDMAHSENQNQPRLWGSHVLGGRKQSIITPRYSLKYWCAVHRRVMRISEEKSNHGRFLIIKYEHLCASPQTTIGEICNFLSYDVSRKELEELSLIVSPPASIGRWRKAGTDIFDREDVDYAASLGFEVV